jgi:hypothetical protein
LVHLTADNLITARLGLARLATDPTITHTQCDKAVLIYGRMAANCDTTVAYLTYNLALDTIPPEALADAQQALSHLQDTSLLAREIVARAKIRRTQPPRIHIPLKDLHVAARLLAQEIQRCIDAHKALRFVSKLPVPTFTAEHLRHEIHVNEDTLLHLIPLKAHVAAWRKRKLSPRHKQQVAAFARSIATLEKLAHDIIATCRGLQLDTPHLAAATSLHDVIADLVED